MLQTEQHRIAGKSRETLVRGIGVARRIQRQNLPQLLSGGGEEIGKFVSAGTKVANAEAAGQGSEVQQNSATSGKFHQVTIRRSARLGQGGPCPSIARKF